MKAGKIVVTGAMILFTCVGIAAAQMKVPDRDELLARISFNVGYPPIDHLATHDGYPQSCFAVYSDGYYQVLRLTKLGPESLQGKLSESQFSDFNAMLKKLDFESHEGGMVRQNAERFTAEVITDGKAVHYEWMNPDHERPFPSSAARIIEWLQKFNPEDASPLVLRELSQHPVCPPASEKNVRPITASVQ